MTTDQITKIARPTNPQSDVPHTGVGDCAICGLGNRPIRPLKKVVSTNYVDYDRHVDQDARDICDHCTWAFRHKPLRQRAHKIQSSGATELCPSELKKALDNLIMSFAVSIPFSRKKHVAPWAEWGRVSIDGQVIDWTDADRKLTETVVKLRKIGFSEAALVEKTPRWPLVKKNPNNVRGILSMWDELDIWRRLDWKMTVGILATRKDKTKIVTKGPK